MILQTDSYNIQILETSNLQGGHKPGKHGKPGIIREFEKLFKSQGKLREMFYFCRKTWKTQGECKIRYIIVKENSRELFSRVSQRKV